MKHFLLSELLLALSFAAHAVSINGTEVKFGNGPDEWSDPVEITLHSNWMEKKGQPAVKLQVRVKVVRKILRGCRYEIEFKNMDENGIRFDARNGNGNNKSMSVKLKPGEVKSGEMDSFVKGQPKNNQDCAESAMNISFHEVEGYKK
jgi:hypothetical protein